VTLSFPGGDLDISGFRTGDAKTMTTINGKNVPVEDDFPTRLPAHHPRIISRNDAERHYRRIGMFDNADQIRDATDQLVKRGTFERRFGGGRDDR
jgi:hypothetical protein